MEYKYLAHLTGRKEYFDVVNKVTDILEEQQKSQLNSSSSIGAMFHTHYSVSTGAPVDSELTWVLQIWLAHLSNFRQRLHRFGLSRR